MMGVKIYRTHITIRKYVFKRIRHVYMKVYRLYKTHKRIAIEQARRCVSYYGNIKNTDSFKIRKKSRRQDIKICKGVIKNYESKISYRTATC